MLNQNSYLKHLTLACLILVQINFSSALRASETENRIIDKAVNAYGGNKLIQLQSMTLIDNMNQYFPSLSGHSLQGPESIFLSEHQIELSIDLLNKRKVLKQATSRLVGSHASDMPTVIHRVFAEGKGYDIDHALQQFQLSQRINYQNVDMGKSLMVDPLIVLQLAQERQNSQWLDIAFIQGEAHDVLKVNSGSEKEYTVYISQDSGYLSRVLRKRGGQLLSYDFLDHAQTQGITWAKQLLVSTEKQPVYHSNSRKISFNSAKKHQFNIPSGYKPRPKTKAIDVSKLTFRKLANDVYFVGQDWAYTLFIDAGEFYISAGAWGMDRESHVWQKALNLLKQKTGNNKPVGQHIVTHHHNDHMMGLDAILEQGANLVIHPADIASVQEHLLKPLDEDRFVSFTDSNSLADGKVMLIDVPNSHANHNLVLYLPEHKILFTEDMFGSSFHKVFHSPSRWPNGDTYFRLEVLTKKVKQLGLEVEQYLSSHHARILNQTEIDKALAINLPSKESLITRLFSNGSD